MSGDRGLGRLTIMIDQSFSPNPIKCSVVSLRQEHLPIVLSTGWHFNAVEFVFNPKANACWFQLNTCSGSIITNIAKKQSKE